MEEIDVTKLVYSFPKKEGNYHVSSIKYGDGRECRLTSSFLHLVDIEDNLVVLSVKRERNNESTNSAVKTMKFYNDIIKIEESTVHTMHKSSEAWFRKNFPLQKLEGMFRSCISRTSDIGQNIFRFKLSKKLKIFNESEENVIPMEELKNMDKKSFRLQCSCIIDNLIIGRDAAKLDIKVTQIRIKKNPPKEIPTPPQEPVVHDSEDELDDDTFECVEPCEDSETKIIKLPLEMPEQSVVPPSIESLPEELKKEETVSRISELKKQLRQAAVDDNDDLVAELSIEIKELKKLLV